MFLKAHCLLNPSVYLMHRPIVSGVDFLRWQWGGRLWFGWLLSFNIALMMSLMLCRRVPIAYKLPWTWHRKEVFWISLKTSSCFYSFCFQEGYEPPNVTWIDIFYRYLFFKLFPCVQKIHILGAQDWNISLWGTLGDKYNSENIVWV